MSVLDRVGGAAFHLAGCLLVGAVAYLALKGAGYVPDRFGVGIYLGIVFESTLNDWRAS